MRFKRVICHGFKRFEKEKTMTENQEAVKAEETVKEETAVAATQEAAVETQAVNPNLRTLEVTINGKEFQDGVTKELRRLAKKAKMPGFRPGHVPFGMVEAMYGQQASAEVINKLLEREANKAMREGQFRVVGQFDAKPLAPAEGSQDLRFEVSFEVYPDIELPDFSGVELKRYLCTVDDAAVNKTIDTIVKQRVTFTTEEGRKAASEDRLTVNFTGTIDGQEFQGGKAEGFTFVLGQGRMLPEFEEAATGMAAGEKKTFTLTFPENYGNKELAGKAAQFDLECVRVDAPSYPEVNDEFAKSLAVESVDALKAEIRNNIEREVQERLYERNRTEAFNAAVEVFNYQAPAAIVHSEQERLRANFQQMLYGMSGQKNKESAPLELFLEPAKKQARIGMMITAIIDQNKIEATDDDIKARASQLAAAYEQPAEVVEDLVKNQRNNLASRVLEEKALEFLFSKAKTAEETLTFEQLSGMGRE